MKLAILIIILNSKLNKKQLLNYNKKLKVLKA